MLRGDAVLRPYWFITNLDGLCMEVFTMGSGAGRVLPVFSFAEEAELFLWLGVREPGWKVRESRAGEILSVLYGPCARVSRVALDPVPEVGGEAMLGLVSVSRGEFVSSLLCEEETERRWAGREAAARLLPA